MSYIFSNDINTTLAVAINSTQTTISVASSANLPTLAAGEVLPITLSDAATHSNYEVCYCTAISGTDLTVLRGMEGTTAQAWLLNDLCYNAHTAGTTASFDGGLGTDSGAANAYVVTVPMTLTAYQVGMVVRFIPANASTLGGSTINVNGLGVVDLLGQAGLALQEKEVATGLTAAIYNGTAFVLLYSIGGTVQVPPATASGQAVNLGQIINNVAPPSIGSNVIGGTALSIGPTGSFTAPSTGNLLVTVFASSSGNEAITASGTASLAALTLLGDSGGNSYTQRILYYRLPMAGGNATTLSASMSVGSNAGLSLMVTSIFQPNP